MSEPIAPLTYFYDPEPDRPLIEDGVTLGKFVVIEDGAQVAHSADIVILALDGLVTVVPVNSNE